MSERGEVVRLAQDIRMVDGAHSLGAGRLAELLVDLGYRKVEVTDEMVERAAKAGHEHLRSRRPADRGPYESWEGLDENFREYLRGIQRAALEAALQEEEES